MTANIGLCVKVINSAKSPQPKSFVDGYIGCRSAVRARNKDLKRAKKSPSAYNMENYVIVTP